MFAAAVIQDFSLYAVLRHEPDLASRPAALLQDDSKKARIAAVSPAAWQAGATAGMTATQAKARCGSLAFRIRSEAQEASAQEVLLECAYGSAAFIESTAPGVCTMDLRGLESLRMGGSALQKWGHELVERLAIFALPARVGVAETPGLALHAARVAEPFLAIDNPDEFWAKLPIGALELEPDLASVLQKWGIRTAAQFLKLGKDRAGERLGAAGLALFESMRTDAVRPLKLTTPREQFEEFFEFQEPVETLEPLLFLVRRLLEQLCFRIEPRGMVAQKLQLALLLDSGRAHDRTLEIPSPTREVEALFRIAHNYLENVRTDSPLKGVRLRVEPAASEARQFQLFETAVRNPNRFYETIGRLGALLGAENVGRPVVESSHKPDDVRMEPIRAEAGKPQEPAAEKAKMRGLMLRRFRPPLRAAVRLRETEPVFVESSEFTGGIAQSAGPWRISGQWWENGWQREEWDVQTKGGALYRLCRDGTEWFVEGAYD
jgi:protein ImuB